MQITETDIETLKDSYSILENPSLVIKLSSAVGMPVEAVIKQLGKKAPKALVETVSDSSERAIQFVMTNTAKTLTGPAGISASPRIHKTAAAATGAAGGFFGIQALVLELPITTGIMFRSIVDIARAEGESPEDYETIIAAMQVFAMGSGTSSKDDAADTSYYGVRLALSKTVSDALQYLASNSIGSATAPGLIRLVAAIANRFGVVVTQKAMAQSLPVLGALGGGLVNTMFISHFQDMARGHFAIRRLEKKYSVELVKESYELLG